MFMQAVRRPRAIALRQSPTQRMAFSIYKKPFFKSEEPKIYAKNSPERAQLTETIKSMKDTFPVRLPSELSGSSAKSFSQRNPSNHGSVVAEANLATPARVSEAINTALDAKPVWEDMSLEDRAAVFLRAAELVAGKYRSQLIAASMLGQGKTIFQAEIDIIGETCDLFRYAVQCAMDLASQQPAVQQPGSWNRVEYRPLEGFIYAVSPFNFTALGANLVGFPLMMGNAVVWKPSLSALHSSYILYQILLEAGLPEGVVQFVPGEPEEVTNVILEHPDFAALHFIGSTDVFKQLHGKIGQATGANKFKSYPRIVGESGGKNFHLVHSSADIDSAVYNTVRGGFEYQGQKCSASSRVYVSESAWPAFKEKLVSETAKLKTGVPEEYSNFINGVIHEQGYDKLADVMQRMKSDPEVTLLAGGKASKEKGYFVEPTVYQTSNPHHELMTRELFGPIIAIYTYPDKEWKQTLKMIDSTTGYALSGSVFARNQVAVREAQNGLKHSAGNFYVNTKCTGSLVGAQPFGGSRGSGTNDKVGSLSLLSRFASVRAIKDEYVPLQGTQYPSNEV